jgi:hypothetical protein
MRGRVPRIHVFSSSRGYTWDGRHKAGMTIKNFPGQPGTGKDSACPVAAPGTLDSGFLRR